MTRRPSRSTCNLGLSARYEHSVGSDAAPGWAHSKSDRADGTTGLYVIAELKYGIAKAGSRRLAIQLAAILGGIDVLPFETPADVAYAELRTRLERAGRPIGGNDMLIAAHALALDLTLVTANEREFSRVPDLRIENWLR